MFFCWTEFYEEESLRAIVLGLVLSVLCFFLFGLHENFFCCQYFFFGCCFFVEGSWIAKKSVRVFVLLLVLCSVQGFCLLFFVNEDVQSDVPSCCCTMLGF